MTYPMAVLIATIIALMLVLTLVVPQFEPIFAGSEDKLPSLTRAVLWLSDNASEFGIIGLLIIFSISIGGWLFLKSDIGFALRENKPSLFPGQKLRDQYIAAQFYMSQAKGFLGEEGLLISPLTPNQIGFLVLKQRTMLGAAL